MPAQNLGLPRFCRPFLATITSIGGTLRLARSRGGRVRCGSPLLLIVGILASVAFTSASANMSCNEQVSLAGEGSHDELAARLEAEARSGPLRTPDRHSLCYAYSKLKRYDDLFQCLDALDGLARGAQARDKRTCLFGYDDVTPTVRLMRAEAFIDLGQYEQAREEATAALAWYEKEGTTSERDILIEALGLAGIAAALDGDRGAARDFHAQLVRVPAGGLTASGLAGPKAMALARLNLAMADYGNAYTALTENGSLAIESFLEKLVHGRVLDPNWVWQDLPKAFLINKSRLGLGRYDEAKAGYDELLALPQTRLNGGISWLAYLDRGLIAERESNRDQAIEFYRRAIDVIESQRSTINTEAAKIGFSGNRQEPYNRIVDLLCSAGRVEECFEFMERAKSRALVDLLASRRLSDLPRQGDPRWGEIRPLILRIEQLDRQILVQSPVRRGAPPSQSLEAEERRAAVKELERRGAREAQMLTVSTVAMKDLRPFVASDETLVEYFVTESEVHAIVLHSGGVVARAIDGAVLQRSVEATRAAIEKKSPDAVEQAEELYKHLIKPLDKYLQRPNLLIIPHGILHSVPFAALFDGKQFLVDRYGIRVLASASVLKQLTRPPPPLGALLAVGNPRGDLPAAEEEARKVALAVDGSQLLLREQATVDAFTASAANHRLIHLATHAEFNAKAPRDSYLQLADGSSGRGRLTTDDVYRLTLGADLVTLSACSSGLHKAVLGDELLGLPREFLAAGASSVVASLWEVEDEATTLLMLNFYSNLGKKNKRDALREAQREVKKKHPKDPFYWAAFYLTGRFD